MSPPIEPKTIKALSTSARWSALTRIDEPLVSVVTWDTQLLRKPRLLVPIDVQALYVQQGSTENFVRLPFATTTPDGAVAEEMPMPFQTGVSRPAGVHLHWAMPDSLLVGQISDRESGTDNRLALPALPDRWVVLRILAPRGSMQARVTGWVIESDTTKVTALSDWPQTEKARPGTGKTIKPEFLTGTVGGSLNWSGVYDAVTNRFAFHDPLTDLPQEGVVGDFASYLVCGWWSIPSDDPLDAAKGDVGLLAKLEELRWHLADDLERSQHHSLESEAKFTLQGQLGLASKTRFASFAPDQGNAAAMAPVEVKSKASAAIAGLFAETASVFGSAVVAEPNASLLHGVVHGVPVSGPVVADLRPAADQVDLAMGLNSDDIASVFSASGLAMSKPEDRRDVERLLTGFTHGLLSNLSSPNGLLGIEETEHASAFSSRPGEPGPTDRLLATGTGNEMPGTRAQRSAQAGQRDDKFARQLESKIYWSKTSRGLVQAHANDELRLAHEFKENKETPKNAPASRLVRRPTPRYFEPLQPMLALRGAARSLRHGFDEMHSPNGYLQCRWPAQVQDDVPGMIASGDLTETFPAGGLPPEVVRLVHNAVVKDPYIQPWLSEVVAKTKNLDGSAVKNRLFAETALRFTKEGRYSTAGIFGGVLKPTPYQEASVAAELNRFSILQGVDSDPIGVTNWAQPWVPMWLEWEVELATSERLEGWKLASIDLDNEAAITNGNRTISGRSPLHGGVASTLANAITGWLAVEDQRDVLNQGEVDEEVERQLATVARNVRGIDIVAASLDSLHAQLLGLPVGAYGVLNERTGTELAKPAPIDVPMLLLSGSLRVSRARLVDAFGRSLDIKPERTIYPARDSIDDKAMALRPRILRPARWLFRLVDPGDLTATPREANIDQLEPKLMVNPVAGFLLPDHVDEALEVFDSSGNPLGQLSHEPISGGVTWEIAPGRDGPPDAGPLYGLQQSQQLLGLFSAAVVATDAKTRRGLAATADEESALSALLRAIDTTLWTVDTYPVLGSSHIVGLVGRPIAVVRATLKLEIASDVADLMFSDPAHQAERQMAYDALTDRAFQVRLGEITKDDDGLLGFFVDDDFTHFHVVDKVVRDSAPDAGRSRGQLGILGSSPLVPTTRPITHPYIVAEDEVTVRSGQILKLTLLMHPGGKCHLTSGILPRKSLQLARDWIHDGLAAIAPSARIGPVLVDSDKVRLPLIASFGAEQLWTRREGNYAWKDDPILAATQTALLPDVPATVEEGYIRIAPIKPQKSDTNGGKP